MMDIKELLWGARSCRVVLSIDEEDAQGNKHSESNGQFVKQGGENKEAKTTQFDKGSPIDYVNKHGIVKGVREYMREHYKGKEFKDAKGNLVIFSSDGVGKLSGAIQQRHLKALPHLEEVIRTGAMTAPMFNKPRGDFTGFFVYKKNIGGVKVSLRVGEKKNRKRFVYMLDEKKRLAGSLFGIVCAIPNYRQRTAQTVL